MIWKLINERHGDWEEDGAGEGGWGSGKGEGGWVVGEGDWAAERETKDSKEVY